MNIARLRWAIVVFSIAVRWLIQLARCNPKNQILLRNIPICLKWLCVKSFRREELSPLNVPETVMDCITNFNMLRKRLNNVVP